MTQASKVEETQEERVLKAESVYTILEVYGVKNFKDKYKKLHLTTEGTPTLTLYQFPPTKIVRQV